MEINYSVGEVVLLECEIIMITVDSNGASYKLKFGNRTITVPESSIHSSTGETANE